MPRLRRSLIAGCGLFLLGSGCGLLDSDARLADLREHQERWEARHIESYRFDFRGGCFCDSEFLSWVTVTVRGDSVRSVLLRDSGLPVSQPIDRWPTVEGIFASIRRWIDGDPDRFEVRYHPELGYPERVAVDRWAQARDDEIHYQVENLAVLAPLP
jgi:hypothetical protein